MVALDHYPSMRIVVVGIMKEDKNKNQEYLTYTDKNVNKKWFYTIGIEMIVVKSKKI